MSMIGRIDDVMADLSVVGLARKVGQADHPEIRHVRNGVAWTLAASAGALRPAGRLVIKPRARCAIDVDGAKIQLARRAQRDVNRIGEDPRLEAPRAGV